MSIYFYQCIFVNIFLTVLLLIWSPTWLKSSFLSFVIFLINVPKTALAQFKNKFCEQINIENKQEKDLTDFDVWTPKEILELSRLVEAPDYFCFDAAAFTVNWFSISGSLWKNRVINWLYSTEPPSQTDTM